MMKYIEIGIDTQGSKIFGRVDQDGLIRLTCAEENAEYQSWLNPEAEQSTLGLVNSDKPAEPVV